MGRAHDARGWVISLGELLVRYAEKLSSLGGDWFLGTV